MKMKDIEVGGEYAVEQFSGSFVRATVLEKGPIKRQVYTSARWDFGGHPSKSPAVRVRIENAVGGREEIVVPAKVARPWAEHAEFAERQRSAAEAWEAECKGLEDDFRQRFGVQVHIARQNNDYLRKGQAAIGANKLRQVIEVFDATGCGPRALAETTVMAVETDGSEAS